MFSLGCVLLILVHFSFLSVSISLVSLSTIPTLSCGSSLTWFLHLSLGIPSGHLFDIVILVALEGILLSFMCILSITSFSCSVSIFLSQEILAGVTLS